MSSKHTPGPWIVDKDERDGPHAAISQVPRPPIYGRIPPDNWTALATVVIEQEGSPSEQGEANALLIASAPDLFDMVEALTVRGWGVERYDEEGIDGWEWTDADGNAYTAIGDWDEPPPWPDDARAALGAERGR